MPLLNVVKTTQKLCNFTKKTMIGHGSKQNLPTIHPNSMSNHNMTAQITANNVYQSNYSPKLETKYLIYVDSILLRFELLRNVKK